MYFLCSGDLAKFSGFFIFLALSMGTTILIMMMKMKMQETIKEKTQKSEHRTSEKNKGA